MSVINMLRPVPRTALFQEAMASLHEQFPRAERGVLILAGLCGSDAHGTKLPEDHPKAADDVDSFGVSCLPMARYVDLTAYTTPVRELTWTTSHLGQRHDHTVHDVRKFFHLLEKGNPSLQGWLWSHPDDISYTVPGALIVEQRELFLSRRVLNACGGYAMDQLGRMERKVHRGYMGEKRKQLVDEHGYDVKHAAHCIRLLAMGIELAATGKLSTRRSTEEAALLRAIKAGQYNLETVKDLTARLWAKFERVSAAADLPPAPDRARVDRLLVDVISLARV